MNRPITSFRTRPRRGRTPAMLSADEECGLVRAWQGHGDRHARDRLINAFAPMAEALAKRYRRTGGEADSDLAQQAQIGLMKAADRFDPDRGNRFSTYAVWWVRAEIQTYTRANMSVVRRPNSAQSRRAASRIAALDAEIMADSRIDPGDADARLADALSISVDRLGELRAQTTGRDHSLNVPAAGDEGEDRIALLVDPDSVESDPLPIRRMETVTLRRILAEALSALPDRERDIVIATQIHDPPATLEGLGAQFGISKERVRQLRERGFERLRETLRCLDIGEEYFL